MSSSESETSESLSRSSSLSSEYCSDVLADSSLGILPYQFEPQVSNASEQMDLSDDEEMPDETEEIEDERLSSLEWCKCGNCQNMQTAVECVCCQDISVVVQKNIEAAMDGPDGTSNKAPTCVTEHPGFLAVCTFKQMGAADCLLSVHSTVQGRCIQKQGRTQSKQAHCIQTIYSVVLGKIGKGNQGSFAIMCSDVLKSTFPSPGI